MRNLLLLFLLFPVIISAQKANIYLDQNGKEINYKEYRELQNTYSSWRTNRNDKSISKINKANKVETFSGNYTAIKEVIEEITGKSYPENTIFLIEYTVKNDYCHGIKDPNYWSKKETAHWKEFVQPKIKWFESKYENTVVLYLFENSITFQETDGKRKIFYSDSKNIFKKTLFQIRAYCGHHAIINPDNNILVYNGESGPEFMAEYLKQKNWKLFFPHTSEKIITDSQ
ncbi:hypothetical protein [Gramella sp. AN32]|uniref:Uncharacterized protein n=1 Tax=Christiangramia antarctica TaxID=2058158 RepID=A0ABW5X9E4_9FLAO|nr:hypothetical protein [Gramella sp. AN32]